MNALERDLKAGDKIVLIDGRVAVCTGDGFGSQAVTAGAALDITVQGHPMRINAIEEIDAGETLRQFGKENGWNDE